MMLPDHEIQELLHRGDLGIDPFDPAAVQPASVDLRLDHTLDVLRPGRAWLDPAKDSAACFERVCVPDGGRIALQPGECALGATVERVEMPVDLVGRLDGKSSIGRLFLLVHATAGFIDPGFRGHITLELINAGPRPIWLYPGMRIAQMSLHRMTAPAAAPYGARGNGSHYQLQSRGPVTSRSYERFTHGIPAGER